MTSPHKYQTVLVTNDWHIPFHDKKSLAALLNFIKDFQPNQIHLNGDIIDAYALSHFQKNPNRLLGLQNEVDETKNWLKKIRQTSPNSKIYYHIGNHEDRIRKYKWESPELSSLKNFSLEELLNFSELNIEKREYNQPYIWKNAFMIYHGTIIRKWAGYTAKAEMEKHGISGISAHTHRSAKFSHTDRRGTQEWYEGGHLSDENQCEYLNGCPDWSQAITLIYFPEKGKNFIVHQIPIKDHKIFFNGHIYE